MPKAPSDSNLQVWWRKAVKAIHGDACKICGAQPVQIHHMVKRRKVVLRHDWRNGLPLCVECHAGIDTIKGRNYIAQYLDMDYLSGWESVTFKDYLVLHGMTRAEFLNNELDELKKVCDNPSRFR